MLQTRDEDLKWYYIRAYIQLTEAAENTPAEVPNPRQGVTYLLDYMKTSDLKVLAGIAMIEQDEAGKRISFEDTVTFLLPSCPVAAKNVKNNGVGAKISGTVGSVPTIPGRMMGN